MSSPDRPLERTARTPRGTRGPTASWAHALWASAYIWLGHTLWTIGDKNAAAGFLVVPGGLLLLRLIFRIKHHRAAY